MLRVFLSLLSYSFNLTSEEMSQKSALYFKRKHSICVKLDQLKTESYIAINYIKKMFDKGTTLVAKLEGVDQTTFLQRYPQVNEELDRLVNKVVHLNYITEVEDEMEDSGELQMNPATSNAALVLPVTAVNFIKEELPLIKTGHIYNSSIPCDIQEGDILDMCYLHGDDPFNFWLRYYSTKALEEVIEIMMCRFNGGCLKSCENPCIGMYICVCDGEYFRGRIMKLLKERVEVLNVDSGQTKVVTIKHIFHLDEDLSSVHVQCINCCLQGDLTDVSLWNDTVANLFSQILRDSNLVVTVRAKLPDGPSHFMVEVDCHNEERIISKIELSKWLTSEVFPLLHQVQQNLLNTDALMVLFRCLDRFNTEEGTDSDVNVLQQSLTFEVNTDDAVDECVEEISFTNKVYVNVPEKPDIPSSLKPLIRSTSTGSEISSENIALDYHDNDKIIEGSDNMSEPVGVEKCMFALIERALDSSVGQCYDAMIAHIEDPGEFYIHVVCAENTQIDNVGKQMNEFYEKVKIPLKTKSEAKEYIGTFCAAYSSNHQHWYRGQIINWNENNSKLIHVKFVDYGDEHFLPLEAIQPLAHVFTKFPIFAQCCDLANIHPVRSVPKNLQKTWPIESINLFKCLVDMNTLYTVIVRKADQNNSLSVLLCDNHNEVCINKSMVNYGYAINFSPFEGPLDFGFHLKNDGKFDSTECKQTSTSLQTELVPASQVQRRASESKQIPSAFYPLDQWDPMGEDFYSDKNNVYHDDEDATYVVTGYKPQDETRICKLFAMTGKCYKGQTCLKQHSFVHPDGWTTDKEEIFHEAFNMLTLPKEGSIISIQITEIVNANTFWAIILDDVMSEMRNGGCNYSEVDGKDQQEETLLTLNDYLNEAHNVKALRRLQIEPAVGQIVLAKYIDNRYYRAQVVESEENKIVVVFVDYGNKEYVNLCDIRGIEQRYLHLPFQAIECVLANVEHITDDVDGVVVFQTLLGENNIVCAKVVNSYEYLARLEVLVIDSEGYDLGTKITQSGCGKACRLYQSMYLK